MFHNNERERYAGELSRELHEAIAQAARPFAPRTVFVLDGVFPYVFGSHPGMPGQPMVLFLGATEALRFRLRDDFVDVTFGNHEQAQRLSGKRPVVLLTWDEQLRRFQRTWQSF